VRTIGRMYSSLVCSAYKGVVERMSEEPRQINIDSPYIKLSVSTKGVYTWDIKALGLDVSELERVNSELIKKFGSQGAGSLIVGSKDEHFKETD